LAWEFNAKEIASLVIIISPLAFLLYVIYKFKKEGIVAVIYFLGLIAPIKGFNTVGIVLILIAILLSIKWKVWPFSPAGKQTSSQTSS